MEMACQTAMLRPRVRNTQCKAAPKPVVVVAGVALTSVGFAANGFDGACFAMGGNAALGAGLASDVAGLAANGLEGACFAMGGKAAFGAAFG